jgi:hypothetical protein
VHSAFEPGFRPDPKLPVPGVGWSAYVLDSEGNTIGLFQPDTSATADR